MCVALEKVAAVTRCDLFLDQWVSPCRHRINLSGHESVVLVPRCRCWKCGEVLGRKYPIMTCLRGVSLPLWSIGPWLIRDSADSSREEPRGILVNYCCSKRPRSANASCPWNRSPSVISFLATPLVWRSNSCQVSKEGLNHVLIYYSIIRVLIAVSRQPREMKCFTSIYTAVQIGPIKISLLTWS